MPSKTLVTFVLFAAAVLPALAQEEAQALPSIETATAAEVDPDAFAPLTAHDIDLAEYKYKARPVVVFADTAEDPAFAEQMRLLEARWPDLAERDVVVITDTVPADRTAARTKLRPRGFMLVIMDKDGQVALRKPFPWDAREIIRAIDRMPDRREELRNKRATGG